MKNKTKLVIVLTLTGGTIQMSGYMIGPFLPVEFKEKNVSEAYIGSIFGVYFFFQMIGSFLIGSCLHKMGRKCALLLSMLSLVLQMVTLGMLGYIEDNSVLIPLAFFA